MTPEQVSKMLKLLQFVYDTSHKPALRACFGDDWVDDLEALMIELEPKQ